MRAPDPETPRGASSPDLFQLLNDLDQHFRSPSVRHRKFEFSALWTHDGDLEVIHEDPNPLVSHIIEGVETQREVEVHVLAVQGRIDGNRDMRSKRQPVLPDRQGFVEVEDRFSYPRTGAHLQGD